MRKRISPEKLHIPQTCFTIVSTNYSVSAIYWLNLQDAVTEKGKQFEIIQKHQNHSERALHRRPDSFCFHLNRTENIM